MELTLQDKKSYLKNYLLIQNGSYADEVKDSIYDYFFELKEEDDLSSFGFLNDLNGNEDIENKIEFVVSKIILHEDDDYFENLFCEYLY